MSKKGFVHKRPTYRVELVRGDLTPDTSAVLACAGCGMPVKVHTPQGRRWLMDRLCTGCFKEAQRWAHKLGDLGLPHKVHETKFRKAQRWHEVRDAWLRTIKGPP